MTAWNKEKRRRVALTRARRAGWTRDAVDNMRAMRLEGCTFSEIARALGRTRNAVIGAYHRRFAG